MDGFPFEAIQELYEVTEYRDGAIYDTRYVRDAWMGFGRDGEHEQPPAGHIFVPKSEFVEGSPRRRKE